MNKLYLAYGSNLNLRQMHFRCHTARVVGWTYLPNTRLIFRGSKSGYYLSIEPTDGETVPCGVFRIFDNDEKALDIYEGYPRFYHKQLFKDLPLYDCKGGEPQKIAAIAYALDASAPAGLPTDEYMRICLQGYRDFNFQAEYLEAALAATLEEME